MITAIKNIAIGAYSGISRNMWLLAIAMFINRCGSMVLLFMSVYLSKHLHFALPQVGIVMSMFGLGSLAGAYVGGRLTDKIGYYPVMVASLFLSGLMLITLGQLQNFYAIAFFTFMVNATGDAFRPANSASISHYASKEKYPQAIALNRLAMNLGFTIGPMLGGFLALINYQFLFWADGLTCIAAAAFLFFVLPKPAAKREEADTIQKDEAGDKKGEERSKNSPLRDKTFLLFLFFVVLYSTSFFQLFSSLPLYYKNEYLLSEKHIGWLMALNGIGVSVVEMFLIFYIQDKWSQLKFIGLGILLLMISFLLYIPFHATFLLVSGMLLLTASEIFAMPFMSTYAIKRAPASGMGRYMALYSMAWSIAQIVAPVLGTNIIKHFGFNTLWIVLAVLCMISFLGFRWMDRLQTTA